MRRFNKEEIADRSYVTSDIALFIGDLNFSGMLVQVSGIFRGLSRRSIFNSAPRHYCLIDTYLEERPAT